MAVFHRHLSTSYTVCSRSRSCHSVPKSLSMRKLLQRLVGGWQC